MILRHPGYDLAIVVRNALGTDGSLFLLALSAFSCCIFAVATTTGLAHLEGVIRRKILGTSFNRTSAERRVGVGRSGRGRGGLKVDVIWVVAHPDAGWATKTESERPCATTAPTIFPPSELQLPTRRCNLCYNW